MNEKKKVVRNELIEMESKQFEFYLQKVLVVYLSFAGFCGHLLGVRSVVKAVFRVTVLGF